MQGNSLRLRLGRSEVEQLSDQGAVEESATFHSGGRLVYRIESRPEINTLQAAFEAGNITVQLSIETARTWASSNEVGLYAQDGALRIAIEKDFRCLTRVTEEPDAFSHPNQ
jgi:hypothetical protein